MENSRNFYNHDTNDEESDKGSNSAEKKNSKKRPIILEGILFNRAEELPEDKKDSAKTEKATDRAIEDILKTERGITAEIVEERQVEVIDDMATAEIGSIEESVAEADQELLENVEARLEQASSPQSPISTESIAETLEVAYAETVEELADSPPIMDQARHDMDEAYNGYWAPDFDAKPKNQAEGPGINGAEVTIKHEFVPPVDVTPELIPTPVDYSAKKPSVFSVFGAYAAGRLDRFKEVEIPKAADRSKEKLKKTVKQLRDGVAIREARIRDLQRERLAPVDAKSETIAEVEPILVETMPMPILAKYEKNKPADKVEAKPARAETLTKEQLVKLAESIKVEGVTVRSMFEVRRFDEKSLRRIVSEYLRSGNVSKVVFEEVERHDKSRYSRFETLNQMKPTETSFAYDHSSLPKPVEDAKASKPAADETNSKPVAKAQATPKRQPQANVDGSGLAEKIVLGAGLVFIFVALVMLFVTIMSL